VWKGETELKDPKMDRALLEAVIGLPSKVLVEECTGGVGGFVLFWYLATALVIGMGLGLGAAGVRPLRLGFVGLASPPGFGVRRLAALYAAHQVWRGLTPSGTLRRALQRTLERMTGIELRLPKWQVVAWLNGTKNTTQGRVPTDSDVVMDEGESVGHKSGKAFMAVSCIETNLDANSTRGPRVGLADFAELKNALDTGLPPVGSSQVPNLGEHFGEVWDTIIVNSTETIDYISWRNVKPDGTTAYLSRTVVENTSAYTMMRFYLADEHRPVWDTTFAAADLLDEDEITGAQSVWWQRKFPLWCAPRDYVFTRRTFSDNGTDFYTISKSTEHIGRPEDESGNPKRVNRFESSWRCRPAMGKDGELSACEVILYHYEDMHLQPDIARLAVRKGMWPCVKSMAKGIVKFMESFPPAILARMPSGLPRNGRPRRASSATLRPSASFLGLGVEAITAPGSESQHLEPQNLSESRRMATSQQEKRKRKWVQTAKKGTLIALGAAAALQCGFSPQTAVAVVSPQAAVLLSAFRYVKNRVQGVPQPAGQ